MTSSPLYAPIPALPSASPKGRMADSADRASGTPRPAPPQGPLGIIAGSGGLPRRVIDSCRAAGRDVFVLALEGEADRATVEGVPHAWCRIGGAATGLDQLRAHVVGELVLAGGVRRPSLAALRPDLPAGKVFPPARHPALPGVGVFSAVVQEVGPEGVPGLRARHPPAP